MLLLSIMRVGYVFLFILFFLNVSCQNGFEALDLSTIASTSNENVDQTDSNRDAPPAPAPASPPSFSGGSGGFQGVQPGATYELQLNADRASRFYIYVPRGYDESQPRGIVLMFHGVEGDDTPNAFIRGTSIYNNRDRYILVSPAGDTNDGGSGAWCQPYTKEIMDVVEAAYNVDYKKKFMAAISGGGYPAIWYGLNSGGGTYTNFCGQTVQAGFQDQFAAVGFTASAYSPSQYMGSSLFRPLRGNEMSHIPSLWADYGSESSDGGRANDLSSFATDYQYNEVQLVVRPGEGHSPRPPFTYISQMFDFFERNAKP